MIYVDNDNLKLCRHSFWITLIVLYSPTIDIYSASFLLILIVYNKKMIILMQTYWETYVVWWLTALVITNWNKYCRKIVLNEEHVVNKLMVLLKIQFTIIFIL